MSTYNYRSLPPGCIRLLRLSPHEDDDAPIQCQLFEYSLANARRKGTHLYEALSYCWGSSTQSQTVFTNEGSLQVTENLHAALLRLRDPALERIIWADAICINQDDLDEKGYQVQLMAEIYARLSCVIVWLENVTGDHRLDSELQAGGRQAIRALEVAATRSMGALAGDKKNRSAADFLYRPMRESGASRPKEAPLVNEQDRLAGEKLLERPWFHRVWVLQEVAAARHVLVMCKFAEIDGQVFCSGLKQMSTYLHLMDEDARSRILSTTNLIKDATSRPKGVVKVSDQLSLQISSLGRLIELHHIREATDRRDKIYALLGMSTNTPDGLVPNYQMSWTNLFPRLVKSLVPQSLSVTTIDEDGTALIKIRGCVIGTVNEVRQVDTWYGQQMVKIVPHKSDPHDEYEHVATLVWSLQATAKRIHRGDTVCLLQGTSLPTIIRAHQDYCSIVTIAIDADADILSSTESWRRNTQLEFLLVWSWKIETQPSTFDDLLKAQGLSSTICIPMQVPDDLNTALMLLETGQNYPAILKVHPFIVACEDIDEKGHPNAVAAARFLDVAQKAVEIESKRTKDFGMLQDLVGKRRGSVEMTEDFLIKLASAREWEPMAFLLATQGKPVTITENIMMTALKNDRECGKMIELLLDGREDRVNVSDKCIKEAIVGPGMTTCVATFLNHKTAQLSITEDVLIALVTSPWVYGQASNYTNMQLLLELRGDQVPITENVLIAAAASRHGRADKAMIGLLLEQKGEQITITESIVAAAAANEDNGDKVMEHLLQWKWNQITITENVLVAAASNKSHRVIELLLDRKGDQIVITEKVLAAAATNKRSRKQILHQIFSRTRDHPLVTNQVLKTVYQNLVGDDEGRATLLEMKEREIC